MWSGIAEPQTLLVPHSTGTPCGAPSSILTSGTANEETKKRKWLGFHYLPSQPLQFI
jgi:hypothetical protein